MSDKTRLNRTRPFSNAPEVLSEQPGWSEYGGLAAFTDDRTQSISLLQNVRREHPSCVGNPSETGL